MVTTTTLAPSWARGTGTPAGPAVAVALLLAATALLWILPPLGLVMSLALGPVLAPWGRRLGERVVVSTVVVAGSVAVAFAAAQTLGWSQPPLLWRAALTAALLAEAAVIARGSFAGVGPERHPGRRAPVWPALGWGDAIGLLAGSAVTVAMVGPYLLAPVSSALTALLEGWDHSSHLPMFVQVMHAQGWDVRALSDDVMFGVYPMLHAALWSVGEWTAGVDPQTPGTLLVQPYLAWSGLTAGVAAALLVWSAASAARAIRAGAPVGGQVAAPARTRAAALGAAFTATWCLLGTFMLMADFAFTNFLLGAAISVAAVVVAAATSGARERLGWFVLPAATVAVAYLYPPLVAGVALAAAVVLVGLLRARSRASVGMIVVGLVCALATVPSTRFLTEPFQGRAVGDIKGGIPDFEAAPAVLLAGAVVLVLLLALRSQPLITRLALAAPLLGGGLVAAYFASQALRSGLPLHESYYTKKVVYALLVASVPLAMALLASVLAPLLPIPADGRAPRRRAALLGAAMVGVVAVAVSLVSMATAGISGTAERAALPPVPPGAWALADRVEHLRLDSQPGTAQIVAARASDPDWVTITVVGPHDVPAGRMAAGLGGVLTWRANAVMEAAHEGPLELQRALEDDPSLRVHVVMVDDSDSPDFRGLVSTFGPDRVRLDLIS